MDTLILQRPQAEKTATSAAGIGIAVCLLLFQNPGIFANDISGITGISPDINSIKEDKIKQEQLFEQEIINKYASYSVINVDKGVKHIKMTKYFNGKPVRINVVEVSKNINNTHRFHNNKKTKKIISVYITLYKSPKNIVDKGLQKN